MLNGTRLIIRKMHSHFIDCEIANGKNKGQRHFIPKLAITPSNSDAIISFRRIQFPFRWAFAMTINKAQGATLKKVGVFLNNPVFSHGQLYVALSRVASFRPPILTGTDDPIIFRGASTILERHCIGIIIFRGVPFFLSCTVQAPSFLEGNRIVTIIFRPVPKILVYLWFLKINSS